MDEVSGALVAIVLVLCAVFVPTLFISGISGAFYKQFAVTISTATVISLLLSLTLSPAMAAILLRERHPLPARAPRWQHVLRDAGDRFNRAFERMSEAYSRAKRRLVLRHLRMLPTYAATIAPTIGRVGAQPPAIFPQQNKADY